MGMLEVELFGSTLSACGAKGLWGAVSLTTPISEHGRDTCRCMLTGGLASWISMLVMASSFRGVHLHADQGARMRWPAPGPDTQPLVLRVHGKPAPGQPSPERLRMAVVNGMRSWNWAIGNQVPFNLWMGPEEGTFPSIIADDDMNAIFWRSAAMAQGDPQAAQLGPKQAAYTKIYFDPANARLRGFDLILNDLDFRFVSREDVALGLAAHPQLDRKELYLEDTVLHELGHALGLDHSLDVQSVLYPRAVGGRPRLSCDDLSTIRAQYDDGKAFPQGSQGNFEGVVQDEKGRALFGVGVMAMNLQNPLLRASTSTQRDGRFRFRALRGGDYAFYVYPQWHVSRYFSQRVGWDRADFCPDPGSASGKRVFPAQWLRGAQEEVLWRSTADQAGPLQITAACSSPAARVPGLATPRFPIRIEPKGAGGPAYLSIADRFRNSPQDVPEEIRYYRWKHPGGDVSIHWVSDAISAHHSAKLALWRPGGDAASPQRLAEEISLADSPGSIHLRQRALAAGEYLLSVQRSTLRTPQRGLLGYAVPRNAYFFWIRPGVGEAQSCASHPVRWPAYEPPEQWPPRPAEEGGCRVSGGRSGWPALAFLLFCVYPLRSQRRDPKP